MCLVLSCSLRTQLRRCVVLLVWIPKICGDWSRLGARSDTLDNFAHGANRSNVIAWFYEIRGSDSAVLKRDSGFATQDAAKIVGRADAKENKNSRQPVERILVGQNAEKPTR
jgi:hypothetical protein